MARSPNDRRPDDSRYRTLSCIFGLLDYPTYLRSELHRLIEVLLYFLLLGEYVLPIHPVEWSPIAHFVALVQRYFNHHQT